MPAAPERQSRHAPNPGETSDQRRLTSDLYLTDSKRLSGPQARSPILESPTSITQKKTDYVTRSRGIDKPNPKYI